jgi:hypothetical protein
MMKLIDEMLDDRSKPGAVVLLNVLRRCAFGFASDESCAVCCRNFITDSETKIQYELE